MVQQHVAVLAELHFNRGSRDVRVGHNFFQRQPNFFQRVTGLDAAIDVRLRHLRKRVVGMASAQPRCHAGGVHGGVVQRIF